MRRRARSAFCSRSSICSPVGRRASCTDSSYAVPATARPLLHTLYGAQYFADPSRFSAVTVFLSSLDLRVTGAAPTVDISEHITGEFMLDILFVTVTVLFFA